MPYKMAAEDGLAADFPSILGPSLTTLLLALEMSISGLGIVIADDVVAGISCVVAAAAAVGDAPAPPRRAKRLLLIYKDNPS